MPQTKNTNISNLKKKITHARKRLNTLWAERGCTDHEVLAAGIELDILINEYHKAGGERSVMRYALNVTREK